MKKELIITIVLLINTITVFAQDWQTDFSEAKAIASKENKAIILVFQGSDWCAPCIKLDREIWSTEAFNTYAKEHYVMLKADFPRRKKNKLSQSLTKANAALAEAYNKNGLFPFVVVLDSKGKVLGETTYTKTTVSSYIKSLDAFIN